MSKNSSKQLVDQLKEWSSWLKFSDRKPKAKKEVNKFSKPRKTNSQILKNKFGNLRYF